MRGYLQHHFDDSDGMSQRCGFHTSAKWPLGAIMWSAYCERAPRSNFPEISERTHLGEVWVLAHLNSVLKLFLHRYSRSIASRALCACG